MKRAHRCPRFLAVPLLLVALLLGLPAFASAPKARAATARANSTVAGQAAGQAVEPLNRLWAWLIGARAKDGVKTDPLGNTPPPPPPGGANAAGYGQGNPGGGSGATPQSLPPLGGI
jgi:hypothetical protein